MEANDDVFFLLKHLSKCIELAFIRESDELGLTPQQGRVLGFIVKNKQEGKKIRQSDLESRFDLSKSTVSGIVKRIKQKGLIYKEKDANEINIYPTEQGIKVVLSFKDKINELKSNIVSGLSDDEKNQMISIINKILNNLKKEGDQRV